jgi:putative ABC transport system permease protein
MNRLESFRQAGEALRGNKLRSLLTMLGVIIGVGAMVVMVAVVAGFQTLVHRQFEGLGSRLIYVLYEENPSRRVAGRRTEGLTLGDVRAIRARTPLVSAVCGELELAGTRVSYQGKEQTVRLLGVEPEYRHIRAARPARGRFIEARDIEAWSTVCVLGQKLKVQLFGREDAIGREVMANGIRLSVIGVLTPKGSVFGDDQAGAIFIPLTTACKRFTGRERVTAIFAQARHETVADAAMDQIWATLMRRHDNLPQGFTVNAQTRVLGTLNTITLAIAGVLAGIASLSLLVGGIGIMNIMLVSVTERTREIGIRKAVGARRGDILWQFLFEAMALSGLGGLIGVTFGYLVSAMIALVGGERLPASVPPWAAGMGVAFAVGVGIVAGVYPALRAARLDPIQALRYE